MFYSIPDRIHTDSRVTYYVETKQACCSWWFQETVDYVFETIIYLFPDARVEAWNTMAYNCASYNE